MGVCCCKRSLVAEKPALHRAPDVGSSDLSLLNPLCDPPVSTSWPCDDNDASIFAAFYTNLKDSDSSQGSFDQSAYVRRRRDAVCGEALSHCLRDAKWWTKGKGEEGEALPTLQRELEIVRQVLLVHPLFASCRDDAGLMQEMLDAFERQETKLGELIAVPRDMNAFHIVVHGRASAKSPAETSDDSAPRPLRSMSSPSHSTPEMATSCVHSGRIGRCTHWDVGEAFGGEGLLYPLTERYRDASVCAAVAPEEDSGVMATTNTTVTWRLSRVHYQKLLRLHYDEQLRRILHTLSQCPLFHTLTPEQLFVLAEKASVRTWGALAPLLTTDEVPTNLFVLMSGTVAMEYERTGVFSGTTRIQAAILSPGDCVGDDEWFAGRAQAFCSDTGAAPSEYAYIAQQPVEAVCLSFQDLIDVLSSGGIEALRQHSRNVQERDSRCEQVRASLRSLVEKTVLSLLSDDDEDTDDDEMATDIDYAADAKRKPGGAADLLGSSAFQDGQQPTQEWEMDDVTVKGADVTNFLLGQFFSHPTYCRADGRERGLSMAAFTAKRSYPQGALLFEIDYDICDDTAVSHRSSVAKTGSSSELRTHLSGNPDRLYVVASGTISVMDTDNKSCIFTAERGGSVGEEALLPPLRCITASPQRTRAVVTSDGGCEVYELSARSFKAFLRRPYVEGIRHFCSDFCALPYAEYFPENYWRFLFHCATERGVVGGDVVALRGARCTDVALLLDGQVNAYREEVEPATAAMDGHTGTSGNSYKAVATFGRGDVVGGAEAMEGSVLAVSYVCERRTRMLCVPAGSFAGLFHPALPYLRSLWLQHRYREVLKA
ncbi:hypothetical protein ABL78_0543 [Leptomonas seymouri]|uniref:Cyclic nucleotide-binding domain-containing protein n=1 Tax=Leptomonas seymouri TaxID=5684 RepID=A0A0N0P8T1_LEPSE|nr:hypothetical protein ABL78_0543 [Leptomonas seymouri]|eukprot:KPI90316.1 hypothetical protein ABL78_0543 [Leptomonas seymouri]